MMRFIIQYCTPVFLVSLAISYLLIKFPLEKLQDRASDRSLHEGIIPRSGGIAIFIALMCGLVIASADVYSLLSANLMLAIILICAVSLADDLFSLSPLLRLVFQLLIAGFIVLVDKLYFNFGGVLPLWLCQSLTLLGLVWMINLYNFMDGMDGFASGMAVIAFSSLAMIGYIKGDAGYAELNALLVAAVLGFGCLNFPPARIFMGDIGSTLLGLLAGLFSLIGWQRGLYPLWVPALLFSPFWVDATYTVLKRMARRERFWLPHRSHFYQRLVLSGLSHTQVVMAEYALMFLASISVLLPVYTDLGYNQFVPLFWAGGYGVGVVLLERWLAHRKS